MSDDAWDTLDRALRASSQIDLADHILSVRRAWPLDPARFLSELIDSWDAERERDPDAIDIETIELAVGTAATKLHAWRARASGQGELPL